MFNNLRELIVSMPTEQACREYLVQQRWNGKPKCAYCGCEVVYSIEDGKRFKCGSKECYKKFSVTVGTFMHASNIKLTHWLMAIYVVTAHKKGISSYQLGKDIGVSQKSAWFMIHRIREMMRTVPDKKLKGIVEADEMYVGGSFSNKHVSVRKKYAEEGNNWQQNKTTVLGMIERGGKASATAIYQDTATTIVTTIQDKIRKKTKVVTDTHSYYSTLSANYKHTTVNHSANQFKVGNSYTNTIEGVFSHFKRMVYGIYHHVSPKHTQRYLDEFIMRYNSRELKDAERFTLSFKNMERRINYKQLIAVKEMKALPALPYTESKRYDYLRKPIMQVKGDEVIAEYTSIREAEEKTGVNASNISNVLKGKRNTAGSYKWIYA